MASGDMRGKTVLVTGGNTGIGRHTVLELARMGARVVFTSRNVRKGDVARAEIREAANTKLVDCLELDLASFASIEKFAKQFLAKYDRLDVLVLNAGLMLDRRCTTADGFESTFGVNHLGHFRLTQLLREHVVASAPARIVVVASGVHKNVPGLDFDDLMCERSYAKSGLEAYSRSKLANILFANELARQLEGTNVTVNSLHPGAVRTEFGGGGDIKGPLLRFGFMLGRPFMLSPERGAQTSIYLASSPDVEGKTGGYYHRCQLVQPSAAAQDRAAAQKLWKLSEELVEKVC